MGILECSHHTDVGKMRSHNEDSLLFLPPWKDPALTQGVSFFGVADGMGGHAAGEVASGLAVETLKNWVKKTSISELSPSVIENAFAEASHAIWEYAQANPERRGMGTTLTAALFRGTQALIGHVGDTRSYLLRNKEFRQLTRDHTLVAEQIRLGKITALEARKHPMRHILSRAMGVREFAEIDTLLLDLAPGDILLFCSDGVYGALSDERIREILLQEPFQDVGRRVVMEAVSTSGDDNTSVVIVRIGDLPITFPGRFSLGRLKSWWQEWHQSK